MTIDLMNGSAVMATVRVVSRTGAEFIGTAAAGVFAVPRSAVQEDNRGAFSRSFRRVDDELATLDDEPAAADASTLPPPIDPRIVW